MNKKSCRNPPFKGGIFKNTSFRLETFSEQKRKKCQVPPCKMESCCLKTRDILSHKVKPKGRQRDKT